MGFLGWEAGLPGVGIGDYIEVYNRDYLGIT